VVDNSEGSAPESVKAALIGSVLSSLAWFVLVAGYEDGAISTRPPFFPLWIILAIMQCFMVILTRHAGKHQSDATRITLLALGGVRICGLLVLLSLGTVRWWSQRSPEGTTEESQGLLASDQVPDGQAAEAFPSYGSIEAAADPEVGAGDDNKEENEDDEDDDTKYYKDRLPKDNLWGYAKKFAIFIPIIWPKSERGQQLRIVGCILCLVTERFLNILQPRQTGIVIDTLTKHQGDLDAPAWSWIQSIALLTLYALLNGATGVSFIQRYIWLPVENGNLQRLHTYTYNHIMELSSDFHDSKQSGKLWYAMWNGYSVSSFLELVLFEIIPVLFDFVFAAVYIYFALDPYLALIVFGTSVLYLWSTTAMISRLNDLRRTEREADKSEYEIMTETMSNWRTVSYFNRVPHEEKRYANAAWDAKVSAMRTGIWNQIEGAVKFSILEIGVLSMLVVSGWRVVHGAPVGDVVVVLTLWGQIVGPLGVIANSFNRIAHNLVDAEDLVKVLLKKSSLPEDPDAKPLEVKQGEVEFDGVNFSYDKKRPILKDVSFKALPGETVALVGETGGGKSTILKLLFRFYDITSGSIKVDGQDIRDVTLTSLRESIGNVPQDATLFNDTVMNNVRYAKLNASDEEVIEACKAAVIHDKIVSFTNGYQSKVGEGGTKISGGELQRLAIARVILQDPRIVLLDEATSSVDTETEGLIQGSLGRLTKGRTTFVIAHRLSTVVSADCILVIRKGEICERGTHKELLEMKGQYHHLWTRQMLFDAGPGDGEEVVPKAGAAARRESQVAAPVAEVFNPGKLTKGGRRSTWRY
jgi:ABC-type transport system involved in Fe-S cluster assembly fused permease/ATPase subunit